MDYIQLISFAFLGFVLLLCNFVFQLFEVQLLLKILCTSTLPVFYIGKTLSLAATLLFVCLCNSFLGTAAQFALLTELYICMLHSNLCDQQQCFPIHRIAS